MNNCQQCGAPTADGTTNCKYCGEPISRAITQNTLPVQQVNQPYVIQQPVHYNYVPDNGINPNWPIRSKLAAGLLGIFLGGIGIHKFYLGKPGLGIIYILLCWTYIPALAGLIEGIIYLASDDISFQQKNRVRIR